MPATFLKYLYFNGISLSITLNTLLGGLPFQTFSARNHEWKRNGNYNLVFLIDWLIWFEQDHCMNCWIRWKIGRYAVMSHDDREACYELPLRYREVDPS